MTFFVFWSNIFSFCPELIKVTGLKIVCISRRWRVTCSFMIFMWLYVFLLWCFLFFYRVVLWMDPVSSHINVSSFRKDCFDASAEFLIQTSLRTMNDKLNIHSLLRLNVFVLLTNQVNWHIFVRMRCSIERWDLASINIKVRSRNFPALIFTQVLDVKLRLKYTTCSNLWRARRLITLLIFQFLLSLIFIEKMSCFSTETFKSVQLMNSYKCYNKNTQWAVESWFCLIIIRKMYLVIWTDKIVLYIQVQ